jgi:hypothetical protein
VCDEHGPQRYSTKEEGDVADGSDGGLHAVHDHGHTCGYHQSHVNLIGLNVAAVVTDPVNVWKRIADIDSANGEPVNVVASRADTWSHLAAAPPVLESG